jgi:hypothetical protein
LTVATTRFDGGQASPEKPWYRHFWPWFLIALPLASVLGGVTTLFIAMDDPDGLVVGDYYKQGLAINRTLAREERARSMGLAGELRIDMATGDVLLDIRSDRPLDAAPLVLRFAHATRAHHDLEVTLRPMTSGRYAGLIQEPLWPGGWLIALSPTDEAWRITGRTHVTPDRRDGNVAAELTP